jgi:hypothetical protein
LKGSLFGKENEFLDVLKESSIDRFNFITEKNKM